MLAMILCAGYGTRLGDLTRDTPKPMLPIKGKPLILYTILDLKRNGFDEIIINLHYHGEQIEKYFGDGSRFGVKIKYVYEPQPLGTAGAIRNAKWLLSKRPYFLVVYGDVLSHINYNYMAERHRENYTIGSIALYERYDINDKNANSAIHLQKRLITEFHERCEDKEIKRNCKWVNAGVYMFSNEIFKYIPDTGTPDFPRDVFPKLIKDRELKGHKIFCYLTTIDNNELYKKAEANYQPSPRMEYDLERLSEQVSDSHGADKIQRLHWRTNGPGVA